MQAIHFNQCAKSLRIYEPVDVALSSLAVKLHHYHGILLECIHVMV